MHKSYHSHVLKYIISKLEEILQISVHNEIIVWAETRDVLG